MDEDFNSDEALLSLGRLGKWQLFSYLYMALMMCSAACFAMLQVVFIGAQPRHHCWIPEGNEPNESIPMVTKDDVTKLDECNVYQNYTYAPNATTEPCPMGWFYDTEVTGDTIVNEWELVCDRSVLTETSQMVLVAGVMVGSVVGSLLADAFGRKITFLSSVILISVITFITAWVDNYYIFVVLRFFTGLLQQAIVLPGFVLSCELFPASDRTVAGLMIQNFWAVGMWALALFAYLLKDWRHLLIFCSFPGVVALPSFWLISESIPWLVAKGRIRDAKKILEKAARWNKVALPEKYKLSDEEERLLKIIDDSKEGGGEKKTLNVIFKGFKKQKADKKDDQNVANYTVLDIFKSCRLTTFALMMCFVWCTSALVYYGLSLNTGNLAGDPYMNFFYSGLVEIPAYTISAVVLQLIGRRWPIFTFHLIAGVALFITIFIENQTAKVTLSMIGKFGISGCFGSVFLWAPELFPTTLRNVGIGIASLGGRVGNIIAPYTPFVSRVVPWLPNIVFGVMCLIAAVFTLLLPETLGRPLPQTIEEVEKWTRTLSSEEKRRYREAKKLAKERRQQEKRAREKGPSSKPLTEKSEFN